MCVRIDRNSSVPSLLPCNLVISVMGYNMEIRPKGRERLDSIHYLN